MLYFFMFIAALVVFLWLRSEYIGGVRYCIYVDHGSDVALQLPSFDQSVLNPRYWHLWTINQWVAFVERNE